MSETNKIYGAIFNILKEMRVEKGGTLPPQMGNAKYATAEAISNATKNLFVENNLILIPEEKISHIDAPDFGDKKIRYLVTITGEYQVVHTEDGSSIRFSGIGQGIATGTAVAANIASTFALKNALQRLFLISEDSVDTAGHVEQAQPKQTEAQRRVTEQPQRPAIPAKNPKVAEMRGKIEEFMAVNEVDPSTVSELHGKIVKETGKTREETLDELYKRLKAGEVA